MRTGGLCLLVTVNVDGYLNRIAAHVTINVDVTYTATVGADPRVRPEDRTVTTPRYGFRAGT